MIREQKISLDILAAMRGNSKETQKAYSRWHICFLRDVCDIHSPDLTIIPGQVLQDCARRLTIENWLWSIRDKQPQIGRASLKMARNSVVFLARKAVEAGVVDDETFEAIRHIKLPAAENGQNPGQWLSVEQELRLLDTLENTVIWRIDCQARNKAFIKVMIYTGLRVSEVMALRWGDIIKRGKHYVLRVHGKNEKAGIVKLSTEVRKELDEWRKCHPRPADQEFIFVNLHQKSHALKALRNESAWEIVQKAASKAGLPPTSPHDCRRSFARNSYDAGCSYEVLRQGMRHEHIEMTEHYVNAQTTLNRTASDFVSDFLEG